jgi:hypothetical protein
MLGLHAEAADKGAILGVFVAEQLDRHRPVEHLVDRLPNLTHAASRQPSAQPVAAGQLAVGGVWSMGPISRRTSNLTTLVQHHQPA